MNLSNAENLAQQLGLKPCPLCGNHIYIDSITLDDNDISELRLHCERCDAEYTLHTPVYLADNKRIVLRRIVDIWNERKDEENEKQID